MLNIEGNHDMCRRWLIVVAIVPAALAAGGTPASVHAQTPPAPGVVVTFESGPQDPTPTNDSTPTFTFSAPDPLATFECTLDGAAPEPCSSPHTTAPLADGLHRLDVRARDAVGTLGDFATRTFTLDTTAPETVLVASPPPETTDRRPSVEFVSDEPIATFECSLDGGEFSACASPWSPGPLALGPHRAAVRALDLLGNADPSPATTEFTVADLVAAPPAPPSEPGTVTLQPDLDSGVRALAGDLALNLDRVVIAIGTKEMPTIVRTGAVTVRGIGSLVPGTLTMVARAPAPGGSSAILRGSVTFATPGSDPLVLRPTTRGRAMMRRYRSLPLLVTARFSTGGLSLSANRDATLVRDWLTPTEARRAVALSVRRRQGALPQQLVMRATRRCGSGCLDVRAEWLHALGRWKASGRAREVDGRLRATLRRPVLVDPT